MFKFNNDFGGEGGKLCLSLNLMPTRTLLENLGSFLYSKVGSLCSLAMIIIRSMFCVAKLILFVLMGL